MEEIFNYHVEFKELTPLVVQRSLRLYIEQFDPEKVYLLKSEVKPFLELTDVQIRHIQTGFQKDNFDYFAALHKLIETAIERSREFRAAEEEALIQTSAIKKKQKPHRARLDYAANLSQLRMRNKDEVLKFLKNASTRPDFSYDDEKIKSKAFRFYEKKVRIKERKYFVDKGNEEEMEHRIALHILKAMTRSLDAHSAYYSPQEAFDLRSSLQKQFDGIGIVLTENFDGVFVAELVDGGPAKKSKKIKVGDQLLGVDGIVVEHESFEVILETLLGPHNSLVSLELLRKNKRKSVALHRERITMEGERLSFEFEPFADGVIGKIQLPGFYDNGSGLNAELDLREALRFLKKRGKLNGLVIDMRENSGGFLSQAVKIASLFVARGVIVISQYSDGEVRYFRDLDGRLLYDGPLVILTSKLSASATEIVAQALQDYGQALVVGDSRTFGKGSMQYQTVTDEDARRFFKVTVGRFYTVSGRSNQIKGVQADIVVPSLFSPYKIGERYLEFPLSNNCLKFSLYDNLNSPQKKSLKSSKDCIPYLERRETVWRKMIPQLKINSERRLHNNKNFQLFLKKIDPNEPTIKKKNYGADDLQMIEAVNIVKDMVSITTSP